MTTGNAVPSSLERPISAAELVMVGAELGMLIENLRDAMLHLASSDKTAAKAALDGIDEQLETLATDLENLVSDSEGDHRGR